MKDIESREDLLMLLERFYEKAMVDELIGHFFTEVAPLNLATHIPLIVDFWETILFDKAQYRGNVMDVHQHLHQLFAFKAEHFARWVLLFQQTIDGLFSGEKAERAKQRGASIATVMQIKLLHPGIHKL